jgi:putative endonuclease
VAARCPSEPVTPHRLTRTPRTKERAEPGRRAAFARERGERAETIVADYLVARGYTILEQNLRLGRLEIDIVARLGAVVSVVEVRTRGETSFLPALATISREKRARLLRAADRLWRDRFARVGDVHRIRIDVAAVYLDLGAPRVEYVEGAIRHEPRR